jgi:hypothetical protein
MDSKIVHASDNVDNLQFKLMKQGEAFFFDELQNKPWEKKKLDQPSKYRDRNRKEKF